MLAIFGSFPGLFAPPYNTQLNMLHWGLRMQAQLPENITLKVCSGQVRFWVTVLAQQLGEVSINERQSELLSADRSSMRLELVPIDLENQSCYSQYSLYNINSSLESKLRSLPALILAGMGFSTRKRLKTESEHTTERKSIPSFQ
ncbi:hypothetical protein FGO68_gene14092 [Halteria grandinella]|uniref:Uncharacterized protein n=1 Tax=Halteria grandinella TaxID=5974 RepID=A0A8J8P0C2_HALGN|nr:hypothetical protein FGO68_gene14092 [Halteria grandinella]